MAVSQVSARNPNVLVALKSPESFLTHYVDRGGNGTFFVPGHLELPPGTEVAVEVAFSEPALTFSTRGIVRWKRAKASRNLTAGVGIEFLPSETGTRDLILRFARGEPIPELHQRARRFPALVELEVLIGGARSRVMTGNVSLTGLFINTPRVAEVNSVVPVRLFPGGEPVSVDTEVRWARIGESSGMGVQFLFDDRETVQHIRAFIAAVRQSLTGGR